MAVLILFLNFLSKLQAPLLAFFLQITVLGLTIVWVRCLRFPLGTMAISERKLACFLLLHLKLFLQVLVALFVLLLIPLPKSHH